MAAVLGQCFHIVDKEEEDFQWSTHPKTVPMTENDTFNIFIDTALQCLQQKLKTNEFASWSNVRIKKIKAMIKCLKSKQNLNISINEKAQNEIDIINIFESLHNKQSKIALNENIKSRIDREQKKRSLNEPCIYLIECTKIVQKQQRKLVPNQTLHTERNINRKRKRIKSSINNQYHHNSEPLKKKRKINKQIECIWLLIDASLSMDTEILQNDDNDESITKYEMLGRFIEKMVMENWSKQNFRQNKMRLVAFSNIIQDLTNDDTFAYSRKYAKYLMKQFDKIDRSNDSMSFMQSIDGLIKMIKREKIKNKENTKRTTRENHRIILFTDGERSRACNTAINKDKILNELNENQIIFDCIHFTRSDRTNEILLQLCQHDNIGKYWSPRYDLKEAWTILMSCPFLLFPQERNSKKTIEI